jgi:hypothetical protein
MTSMNVRGRIPGANAPAERRLIAGLKPRASTASLTAELKLRACTTGLTTGIAPFAAAGLMSELPFGFAQDKKLRRSNEPVPATAGGGF